MSGERSVEGAVEVDALDRVQIIGERHHRSAGFHDGQGHAGVADHVGVGGALGVVETRAWRDRPACRFGDSVRYDKAVSVPVGRAVSKSHTMHHPGAGEPVRVRLATIDGIGAIADQSPVEFGGDRAGDGEGSRRDLLGDGGVIAGEIRVDRGHGGDRGTVAQPLPLFANAPPVSGGSAAASGSRHPPRHWPGPKRSVQYGSDQASCTAHTKDEDEDLGSPSSRRRSWRQGSSDP